MSPMSCGIEHLFDTFALSVTNRDADAAALIERIADLERVLGIGRRGEAARRTGHFPHVR